MHVDREPGDALVLRRLWVGAGDEHAEVGDLSARRPDLLAVDVPQVAVTDGSSREAGEVRARAGLAEQLAPRPSAGDEVGDVALDLRRACRASRWWARRASAPSRSGAPSAPNFAIVCWATSASPRERPSSVAVGGKQRRGPTGHAETLPPLADRQVGIPALFQPALQLVHGTPCHRANASRKQPVLRSGDGAIPTERWARARRRRAQGGDHGDLRDPRGADRPHLPGVPRPRRRPGRRAPRGECGLRRRGVLTADGHPRRRGRVPGSGAHERPHVDDERDARSHRGHLRGRLDARIDARVQRLAGRHRPRRAGGTHQQVGVQGALGRSARPRRGSGDPHRDDSAARARCCSTSRPTSSTPTRR